MKPGQFFIPVTIFTLSILPGCYNFNPMNGIRGEGPVVERKLDISDFKGINLSNSAKVYLTQGDDIEVRVEAQENIIDNLTTDVNADIWRIGNKRPVFNAEPVRIHIKLHKLVLAKISGSGNITGTNLFTGLDDIEFRISGSGNISLETEADDIKAAVSGSGDIGLSGTADNLDFTISGSGNIMAGELAARDALVRVSGSGNIEVNLSDRLDGSISGSGEIYYSGNPKVNSRISGSGKIRSK